MRVTFKKTYLVCILALCSTGLSSFARAESADPRGFSADEQIRQTQSTGLKPLKETLEKQSNKPAIDKEETARELDESDAEKTEESSILSQLPSFNNLKKLAANMRREPNNLDHYFAHAQMASQLGEYAIAADTYEKMLALAPTLDRIRLDLGSTYLRLGRFEQAREQLIQVLDKKIPDNVRANVEKVLAKVDSELNEHDISGLISAGMNWDSNAASAPAADSIVIQDTVIPLSGEQLAQQDLQFFTAMGLNHSYRPRWAQDENFSRRWQSSANYYRAKQSTQEALNVEVYGLRTGPEFVQNKTGISISPGLSYNHIMLAGYTYLRSTGLDTRLRMPITERLSLSGEAKYEHRNFQNSPTVSVFELREGHATQFNISANYIATETDFINASLTARREKTQEAFFNNEQLGGTVGYTRILEEGTFLSSTFGFRHTTYDAADTLISAQTRIDNEYSAGLTLGHQLTDDVTATIGYQFRAVRSNIRNFDYDNHRLSASLSKAF